MVPSPGGGRRVPVRRPRVRTIDGKAKLPIAAYDLFASRDLLTQMAVARMLASLPTRRYPVGLEPVGSAVETTATGTSKSAVSRRFVARTKTAREELMARPLADLRPLVLMIDGVQVADHLCVVAMVIDADGRKIPVGLVEGAMENATVVTRLLDGLVARGLDAGPGLLVVLDGSRALAAGIRRVFGKGTLVHRCQEHKVRNVLDHLPKERHGYVERKMRAAYALDDAERAERELNALADALETSHPGAASSLGTCRDAHREPAAAEPDPPTHAALDQPDGVHDRNLPDHSPQRQALRERKDDAPVDCCRHVRGGEELPLRDTATFPW